MGIPRFGELIRRRYPNCWFQEGRANVLSEKGGRLDLSAGGISKKRFVDTLYIDGNGLLHPAMQYTFGYGSFESSERQEEIKNRSEDELIVEGANNFMNAVESLCLEFHPERLVIAIDGSAPVAKMIQQRQRRFGAKMDVNNDPALSQAWESTLKRSVRNSIQEEGSYVSITIEFDAGRRDFGEGLISARMESLQVGTIQDKILQTLNETLVKGKGQGEKVRWYNVLSPETPLGFFFEGKWWYSVAMCACALAWKEVWKQNTYASLFGMDEEPELGINRNNKYLFGTGKIITAEDSPVFKYVEEFRKFKQMNQDFLVSHSKKIAQYCEKIGDALADKYQLYREVLLLTGVGTNIERLDGKRIDWLMNVRAKLIKRLETQISQSQVESSPAKTETDYADYENGFRGVEGVMHVTKFDSSSLTPGTHVMDLIDKTILGKIRGNKLKLSNGASIEVLYSGHMIPGEGEHKIENLIDREDRNMSGKVSLVYGLDADLFMLSMVRKHPVCLVRENSFKVEKFRGEVPSKSNKKHASCHVVDISALQEMLENDSINPIDFTLICFLFGNDFLRNVPGFVFDSSVQVVFDNKLTRNDEETNPYLFDFIFDIYRKIRSRSFIGKNGSLFVSSDTTILKLRWNSVFHYLDELSKYEKNIMGGMIRKMQKEEDREREMTEKKPDYVPVSLRYALLKNAIRERQVVKGGVIDQRAEWIRGIDAYDHEEFKKSWVTHITANIPGLSSQGFQLSRNKEDVLEFICLNYMEGIEWALKYYTNMHSFVSRGGPRKSTLYTGWCYPYFQAPMISHLRDCLWEAITRDSRFALAAIPQGTTSLEVDLGVLFSPIVGRDTVQYKDMYPKEERDILNLLPSTYFSEKTKTRLTEVVRKNVIDKVLELKASVKIPSSKKRHYESIRSRIYNNENTFCSLWVTPKNVNEDNLLVAPHHTDYRVQLLAVLPSQSSKYFPLGIQPSNPNISWMFPTGVPVDFTFKDRVHAAVLMLPPPNINYLKDFVDSLMGSETLARRTTREFPDSVENPRINSMAQGKKSEYANMKRSIENIMDMNRFRTSRPNVIDLFAGVGVGSMVMYDLGGKVQAYEGDRENFEDLQHNVKGRYSGIELNNEYLRPRRITRTPDVVLVDLPYDLNRRGETKIRVKSHHGYGEIDIEEYLEELIGEFDLGYDNKVLIIIKQPRYGKLDNVVGRANITVKSYVDRDSDPSIYYTSLLVERRRGRLETEFERAYEPRSPEYTVNQDYQPYEPYEPYEPLSPEYTVNQDYQPYEPYEPLSPEYAVDYDYTAPADEL